MIESMIAYVIGGILLGWFGYATVKDRPPKEWDAEEHREMIMTCKAICPDTDKINYTPITGDFRCECNKEKR